MATIEELQTKLVDLEMEVNELRDAAATEKAQVASAVAAANEKIAALETQVADLLEEVQDDGELEDLLEQVEAISNSVSEAKVAVAEIYEPAPVEPVSTETAPTEGPIA